MNLETLLSFALSKQGALVILVTGSAAIGAGVGFVLPVLEQSDADGAQTGDNGSVQTTTTPVTTTTAQDRLTTTVADTQGSETTTVQSTTATPTADSGDDDDTTPEADGKASVVVAVNASVS